MDTIKAILETTPPSPKKTLRSFLGMISFYRRFIPNAANLSDLLRKGVREPLPWINEVRGNFEKLKASLATCPILRLPNPNLPFVLRANSSDFGLGAVLLQYTDGVSFPIAYAS